MNTTGVLLAIALLDDSTVQRLNAVYETTWRHIVNRLTEAYENDGAEPVTAFETAWEDVEAALAHAEAAAALIRSTGAVPPR